MLQRECFGGRRGETEETEEEEGGCGGQQQGGDHVDHDDGEMLMKQRRREGGELANMFSSSFQGKLHHLDVGAGGELRLLGKHGPKSAGGLCRQFEVLVHTLGQLCYYGLKNAWTQQTWPCYFFNMAVLI